MLKFVIKKMIGLVLVLAVLGFGLNKMLDVNDYRQCDLDNTETTTCQTADAVVVISGGDTAARTRYAATLVKKGLAPLLIVSGASQDPDVPSNAEEMRDIARDEIGISSSRILLDERARNTHQNASYVKELIDDHNAKKPYEQIQSVILVTSGYHQNRAYKEFRASLNVEMPIYNAPVTKDKDWSNHWYLTLRGWYLAIAEAVGSLLALRAS